MTVYKRFGTREQHAEAMQMEARIREAEAEVAAANMAELRRRLAAAEHRARMAKAEAAGSFMERAQAARDWAEERWPESRELGADRIAAAVREMVQYGKDHPGSRRSRSKARSDRG